MEARPSRHDAQYRASDDVGSRGELRYHAELDGIRAFAVLAVIVFHYYPFLGGYDYLGGFLGVDVFFVLSGYLITTLLVRERAAMHRISLGRFYVRRALRLLPALALTLILAGLVYMQLDRNVGSRPYWQSALFAMFYVANWAQASNTLGVLGHTWSLSIEEQYYLLWPVALIVVSRIIRSRRLFALLVFVAAAGVAILRLAVYSSGHPALAALSTVTRTDGVLIGSALALALSDPSDRLKRLLSRWEIALLATCSLVGASLVVRWNTPALYRGGLFALNICAATVVAFLVLRPDSLGRRFLSRQPLPYIGRISYGLYLFHIPINYLVVNHPIRRTGIGAVAAAFVLTFVVASASFWFVERPILRLKRRFGSMSRMPEVAGSLAST